MLLSSNEEGIYIAYASQVLQITSNSISTLSGKIITSSLSQEIEGILGIIELKTGKYVITINSAEKVGKIIDSEVYKVTSSSVLPLKSSSSYDADEHKYLDLLRFQLDSSNLYYSKTYDLTNSAQRNFAINKNSSSKSAMMLAGGIGALDSRFFWNYFLCKDLIQAYEANKLVGAFITPVISGYVKMEVETVGGAEVTFGLVTRRSRFRAGTRYFRRGIDSHGNVANYNETEQLLVYKNTVQSYLQTRGSVPVYWAEVNNLKYKPVLAVSSNSSLDAARLHFDEQVNLYGDNYLVNLVNQKGYEKPVKDAYEKLVDELDNEKVKYIYFDFHHECRKMQWHRVKLLLDRLAELGLKKNDHFFGTIDKHGATTLREQSHVVRTNCMDCLDRTNVVQSTLGRFFLQSQLEQLNLLKNGASWESNPQFHEDFMNIWADNADAVSSVYSGTGALKTDFTRTGKRTRKGAYNDLINSLTRYYKNNYQDGARQDSFDLILGEFVPPKSSSVSVFADSRLYQFKYVLKIFVALLFVIVATLLKALVYGVGPKQHALLVLCGAGVFISGIYMVSNGVQVVDWPKLKPLVYLKKVPVYQGKKFLGYKYVKNSEF